MPALPCGYNGQLAISRTITIDYSHKAVVSFRKLILRVVHAAEFVIESSWKYAEDQDVLSVSHIPSPIASSVAGAINLMTLSTAVWSGEPSRVSRHLHAT